MQICVSGTYVWKLSLLESCGWAEDSEALLFLFLLQAECIKTGTGTHTCVCQQGWTGNGRDCLEINNCLLPSAGGCHDNATCLYVGPGQVGWMSWEQRESRNHAVTFLSPQDRNTLARTYCSFFQSFVAVNMGSLPQQTYDEVLSHLIEKEIEAMRS